MYSLKIFYDKFNWLPVSGALPDMSSETSYYIEMKKIYETRAKQDKEQLITICEQILKGLKLTNENDYFKVVANSNYNLIDIICKNWTQLKLFEYSKFETTLPDISEYGMCENHEKVNLIWYFQPKQILF